MTTSKKIVDTIHKPGVDMKLVGILYAVSVVFLSGMLGLLLWAEGNQPKVWIVMGLLAAICLILVWFVGEMKLALEEHKLSLGTSREPTVPVTKKAAEKSTLPKHGLIRRR